MFLFSPHVFAYALLTLEMGFMPTIEIIFTAFQGSKDRVRSVPGLGSFIWPPIFLALLGCFR